MLKSVTLSCLLSDLTALHLRPALESQRLKSYKTQLCMQEFPLFLSEKSLQQTQTSVLIGSCDHSCRTSLQTQLTSQLGELSVRVPVHTSKGRPTLRSIHQCTWPKRPTAYVLCHLLCPMVPPDKLFMDSHLKSHSVLMRSTFLVSVVQFLLPCHITSSPKGNCKVT